MCIAYSRQDGNYGIVNNGPWLTAFTEKRDKFYNYIYSDAEQKSEDRRDHWINQSIMHMTKKTQ